MERYARHRALMSDQLADRLAVVGVPEQQTTVARAGGDNVAFRTQREPADRAGCPGENTDLLAGGNLHEADGLVGASGEQGVTVGGEEEARDACGVRRQRTRRRRRDLP